MITKHTKALSVGLAALLGIAAVSTALAQDLKAKQGKNAFTFSASGTDGKKHSLSSLTKSGPVVLYFIKIDCPINHQAAPYFKKLADSYKGKAKLVGVIDGSVAAGKEWLKEYKSDFLVLSDTDHKIIEGYGALYSPWAIQTDGKKVNKVWPGGSETELKEINTSMAKTGKIAAKKLSFAGAPRGGG